jgi:hypothetical protein
MDASIASLAGDSVMLHPFVALAPLIVFAIATSACTPLKARDREPNEGGGSSMYRAVDSSRTH